MAIKRAQSEFSTLLAQHKELPFRILTGGDKGFLAEHDSFVFDCDGVLYSGSSLLPGVAAVIETLRERGARCLFVTNNSGKSRESMSAKLGKMGLCVSVEDCIPASFVTARVLKARGVEHAYVIGGDGLVDELRLAGIRVSSRETIPGTRSDEKYSESRFEEEETVDPTVSAVVVGMDASADIRAIALASLHLEEGAGSCIFVSTNSDAYDVVGGRRMPGNGCIVSAVATCCGRPPDITCGKPSADLAAYLMSTYALEPGRTCVVGDRMDTDIRLATEMQATGLLVLTGCTTAADAAAVDQSDPGCPDFVTSHLGALLEPGEVINEVGGAARSEADRVLDAFHEAAAVGDGDAYAALLSTSFVFLGTDATERWEREAFEAYARDRFLKGNTWEYRVLVRHTTKVSDDVIVFDESLHNSNLGICRSTGVLINERSGRGLKLAQYGLSLPIPNDMALSVAQEIVDWG